MIRASILVSLITALVAGCAHPIRFPQPTTTATATPVAVEQPVTLIPLSAPLADRRAELSSMAWYGDALVLVPQFPQAFGDQLFYISKQAILDFLQGVNPNPLTPQPLPLVGLEMTAQIAGYQGFEAIAFAGEQVFLTVEAKPGATMMGHLVTGVIAPDLSELRLDPHRQATIQPQASLDNMTDEAIVIADGQVLTFYEANGFLINRRPVAHRFAGDSLQPLDALPIPNLEYRLTDATPLDAANRFWVINYFFPGDEPLKLGPDPLAVKYGAGPTHQNQIIVERLVELQYASDQITLVDIPPIQLQLLDGVARNWEGIVRLETPELNGFLLVTDRFPETLLAFVAFPD